MKVQRTMSALITSSRKSIPESYSQSNYRPTNIDAKIEGLRYILSKCYIEMQQDIRRV